LELTNLPNKLVFLPEDALHSSVTYHSSLLCPFLSGEEGKVL